jgi:hypothetical protein
MHEQSKIIQGALAGKGIGWEKQSEIGIDPVLGNTPWIIPEIGFIIGDRNQRDWRHGVATSRSNGSRLRSSTHEIASVPAGRSIKESDSQFLIAKFPLFPC